MSAAKIECKGFRFPFYARAHLGVVWVACWAHARRKFFEAQAEQPKATRVVLRLIARLYRLERAWDEAGVAPAERAQRWATGFARTLMQTLGLEPIYRRPNLSKAAAAHPVYPYLLRNLAVTRPNQMWASKGVRPEWR